MIYDQHDGKKQLLPTARVRYVLHIRVVQHAAFVITHRHRDGDTERLQRRTARVSWSRPVSTAI